MSKIGYGLSVNSKHKYYSECDDNEFYIQASQQILKTGDRRTKKKK